MRSGEGSLQFFQLVRAKSGAVSSLFSPLTSRVRTRVHAITRVGIVAPILTGAALG